MIQQKKKAMSRMSVQTNRQVREWMNEKRKRNTEMLEERMPTFECKGKLDGCFVVMIYGSIQHIWKCLSHQAFEVLSMQEHDELV